MGKHVIVGAGQVGSHLVERLTGMGHDVTVVTRSGSGPEGVERVLLQSRIREGLPTAALTAAGRTAVAGLIADGLVDGAVALAGRVELTLRGRLLADAVVRRLLAD